MVQLTGKSIFEAIAIGPLYSYPQSKAEVVRCQIENAEKELERFEAAKKTAGEELSALYEKAVLEIGKTSAAIFEVHGMLLENEEYLDFICNIIRSQKVNAEFAVAAAGDHFAQMFAAMDEEYMQARAGDIKDISEHLIKALSGKSDEKKIGQPVILTAEDLVPSEIVRLDKSKLLAIVTEMGSINSHTAILARTMGIPAVIGIRIDEQYNGKRAIVDGNTGTVIIDPTDDVLKEYQQKKEEQEKQRLLLQELKGRETITRDGKEIGLYANIGNAGDVADVLANDADGIGLFRSEFLYLQSEDYPTEEEQFRTYKAVVENMAGKKVIIRTFDIGADKQADYFGLKKEENPAMGLRAIRICLMRPELFKTQLRAILRASIYGNVSVMFPMITSLWEIQKIKEIFGEVRQELLREQISFKDVEIGVMIETPAAVMISDLLAKEVDFFSIGTNDLTQYTLALDRRNESLSPFCDAHHEAILRMIEMTVKNAHRENIRAGICGELAADMEMIPHFIRMGVDELSVSCSYILPIRRLIGELSAGHFVPDND